MPFMVPEAEAQDNSTASDPNYDTTPPVVTVPADINLTTTNSQGWVNGIGLRPDITSTGPWATDESGVASFSCNFPSGNLYPIGTTTVTCTASDGEILMSYVMEYILKSQGIKSKAVKLEN